MMKSWDLRIRKNNLCKKRVVLSGYSHGFWGNFFYHAHDFLEILEEGNHALWAYLQECAGQTNEKNDHLENILNTIE
jgi:hypothetical protein